MNDRKDIANRLANFILANNLCQVYGGSVSQRETKGKPYSIGFSIARYLDGTIDVYGKGFILIHYHTAFRDLPPDDRRVFTSVEDAENFLKAAFVDFNSVEALAIKTKQ